MEFSLLVRCLAAVYGLTLEEMVDVKPCAYSTYEHCAQYW